MRVRNEDVAGNDYIFETVSNTVCQLLSAYSLPSAGIPLRNLSAVVAVATGSCSADTLREAGAELVLTDLSDTPAVIRAILGVTDDRP